MIDNIKLTNKKLNESITIGSGYDKDYILSNVNWDSVGASISTYSFPGQIGSFTGTVNLKERTIKITGYIWARLTNIETAGKLESEILELKLQKIKEKQEYISILINPSDKDKLVISVGDFNIAGTSQSSIQFAADENENNEVKCKFMFSIYCSSPMFKMKNETETILSGTLGKFRFPLRLAPTGNVMGERINYKLVTILNDGNIDVGGIITLKALGVVKNPVLTDVYTGNSIRINRIMQLGEVITINTNDGEKSVVGMINGITYNYFKYWDYTNNWLKFAVGYTLIGFEADEGTYELLDVNIGIQKQFFSLGGQ